MKNLITTILLFSSIALFSQDLNKAGTEEDRKALFDYIIEKTKIRESRSPIKEKQLNFNPLEAMLALEDEVVSANTEDKLFYALKKLSAARKNRHLSVEPIENGLTLSKREIGIAPLRFHPDYSDKNNITLFVSDLGKEIKNHTTKIPEIGDQLVAINGENINSYIERAKEYTRYSTYENFIRRMAHDLTDKNYELPASFFKEKLNLTIKPKRGKQYTITLPYLKHVEWNYGRVFNNYNGFKEVTALNFESFKLYMSSDPKNETLVLWWYGFRGDLPEAIDALVLWAEENNALDFNLIIDALDSRGGSQGAYALARLSPKPFKTTGGNLKLSDITYDFISDFTDRFLSKKTLIDHDSRETEDDGTWAVEWLNGPVLKGLAAGQDYSNNVPFKCAHLPYYSDWIMKPAEKHFTGKLVAFFGPWGGSHLTQFSTMIIDNNLGHTIGMPDGGYSNTWEWTEILKFPTTGKPVSTFMWDIGHTIRPNGELAEGNPPMVDDYIPVTKDNYLEYKTILMDKAKAYLSE